MKTLSIPKLIDFCGEIAIRMNDPVMAWGQPGVGKSQAMWQLAMSAPKRYPSLYKTSEIHPVMLAQYDSVDIRGIPTAEIKAKAGRGFTVWNPPETLPVKGNPKFKEDPKHLILLFLDEITSAQESVASVAYQLVLDRRVGEHELMDNVRIVAAGNRDGDKGATKKMPTPLCNRFTHVEAGLDVDAVCVHFQRINLPAIGVAFLQFRKPLVSTFIVDKGGTPTVTLDKAFATPRTWEKALRYFADTTLPNELRIAAMAGAVGDGPTDEFWGFVDVYEKIKGLIPQIMKDPVKAEVPQERSLMYAVTVALSGTMTLKSTKNIYAYLTRLDPEFVILAWMLAVKRDDSLYGAPEYIDFSKQYKAVFN
jgi:hypothetical protein